MDTPYSVYDAYICSDIAAIEDDIATTGKCAPSWSYHNYSYGSVIDHELAHVMDIYNCLNWNLCVIHDWCDNYFIPATWYPSIQYVDSVFRDYVGVQCYFYAEGMYDGIQSTTENNAQEIEKVSVLKSIADFKKARKDLYP